MLKLLDRDCAKIILQSALLDINTDMEDDGFKMTEYAVTQALLHHVTIALQGSKLRISQLTFDMVNGYLRNMHQADLAASLHLHQSTISERLLEFRKLLLAQHPRIVKRWPQLEAINACKNAPALRNVLNESANCTAQLLNALKEGTL